MTEEKMGKRSKKDRKKIEKISKKDQKNIEKMIENKKLSRNSAKFNYLYYVVVFLCRSSFTNMKNLTNKLFKFEKPLALMTSLTVSGSFRISGNASPRISPTVSTKHAKSPGLAPSF